LRHWSKRLNVRLGLPTQPVDATQTLNLSAGFQLENFTWPFVELTRHIVQIGLRVHRQVGALRKVLSQLTIGVLVRPALSRALRIAEVNVDVGRRRKSSMIGKFLARSQVSDLYSSLGSFFACLMRADTTVRVSLLATFASIT
jgi:hypothetical protein